MKITEKIGLIGVGNMGTAILEGLLNKELAAGDQIWIYDKLTDKTAEFSAKHEGVTTARDASELVRHSDLILLAVKPQNLRETAACIEEALEGAKVLVSILAGTPLGKIKAALKKECRIVRAMPNLGARVAKGVTALAGSDPKALDLAEKIFSGCGEIVRLEEKHFDAVTAISGSGPAYFFFMMELLVEKAVSEGIPAKEAQLLAVQTAVGAALLAESATQTPKELREMVTSKGGTTEAALEVLRQHKFPENFELALQAAIDRGRKLSQL